MGTWGSRIVALCCIGLLSGAMLEEYFVLQRVLARLDGPAWAQAHAAFATFHPWSVVPLAVLGTIAIFVAAALERPRSSARSVLTWIVAATGAAVGVLTMAVMFPLNEIILRWTQEGVPADWQEVRDRWIGLQGLRALLSVAGFLGLVVSSLIPHTVHGSVGSMEER